jgi:mono/diheme cytochrome c family protein
MMEPTPSVRSDAWRRSFAWWLTACFVAAAGTTAAGQAAPLVINSLVGRDLFQFYCATCHGRDGKGAGPVAAAIRTPPADLTEIARKNGGRFPRAGIVDFIENGRPLSTHGPQDMPVWGPIFRALDASDTRAKIRIDNLVSYLESLQAK